MSLLNDTNTTRDQVIKKVPNPTGKGGFQERPQDRNPGTWNKEDSISFQYNMLIRLDVDTFLKWKADNPSNKRTVAQEIAYNAVVKARNTDLGFLKEITDRVEGKPMQRNDITTNGKELPQPILNGISNQTHDLHQNNSPHEASHAEEKN